MIFDREKRLTREAVEQVDESLLRGLCNRVNRMAAALDGEQHRRRRKIAVPNVVVNSLKMPEALAGARIDGDKAIGKQVVANAVRAIKIECGRTRGDVDDATGGVERHPGPVVGGAASFPRVRRPGVVTKFAGQRDGMKGPAKFSGAHVESANVARRGGKRLRIAPPDDDRIFKDEPCTGEIDRVGAGRFAVEVFAKIDTTRIAKVRNGFAGGRVERIKVIHYADENPGTSAGTPIREAPIGLCACNAGVKFPSQFSGGGIEGKNLLRGSDAIKNSADNQGIGLQTAFFASVEVPGNLKFGDIAAIYLCERRVVIVFGVAAVARPVLGNLCGGGSWRRIFLCCRGERH